MMVIYGLTSEYTLLSAMFIINNNILNINIDINISIGIIPLRGSYWMQKR